VSVGDHVITWRSTPVSLAHHPCLAPRTLAQVPSRGRCSCRRLCTSQRAHSLSAISSVRANSFAERWGAHRLPGPVAAPAAVPVVDGLPVPVLARQVPPWASRPDPEEDPVDHHPVVVPPVPLPGMPRQQPLQPRPLIIGQVMPLQPVSSTATTQRETTTKILQDTL
jgi:hypothetical protein